VPVATIERTGVVKRELSNELIEAAIRGTPNEIEFLILKHGIDPNTTDKKGNTGFKISVQIGSIQKMKTFLRLGADPDKKNNAGESPAHIAVFHNDMKVLLAMIDKVNILVMNKKRETLVYTAAECDCLEIMDLLLKEARYINRRSYFFLLNQPNIAGLYPLDIAVQNDNGMYVMPRLVRLKAKCSDKTRNAIEGMLYTVNNGSTEFVGSRHSDRQLRLPF
jgi:ankyrin repeat protein